MNDLTLFNLFKKIYTFLIFTRSKTQSEKMISKK